MNTDFLVRIRRELHFTVAGFTETVLAIAFRVNRKVQAIKLHWHAATITRQIALAHQHAGSLLCDALAAEADRNQGAVSLRQDNLQAKLEQLAATLRLLKRDLAVVDRRVAEVEAEALVEDLLAVQQDLSTRGLRIARLTVAPEAPAVGLPAGQVPLSPGTRILAVLRGPMLLPPDTPGGLREGDIVILLGWREDLERDSLVLTERARATA
jgi:K+/H+ antiporter YhaU regulatory subunit KhtT